MALEPRRLTQNDIPYLRQFWMEHWGSDDVVIHGEVLHPDQFDGFVVEEHGDWTGLITFICREGEMEVTSLDSLREGQGLGSKLIDLAVDEARKRKCKRLLLNTTNDNLHAIGFYQKRGFQMAAIHRGAVDEARKLKPSIPKIGAHGIPMRDEIELEMTL
jgi:ribosomal protein S18 acetylase RimI-like enzyme